MSLTEFVRVGLYDPDAENGGERRELLEHLLARGFSPSAIIAAAEDTPPVYLAARLSRSWQPNLSLRMLIERCGIGPDELADLRRACGFPVRGLDVVELPEFWVDLVATFQLASAAFGRDETMDFLRILGATAARLVEASRSMFSAAAQEDTELTRSQRNESVNALWPRAVDALGSLIRERVSLDHQFSDALLRGTVWVAVGFVDLVDSTGWTATLSPAGHSAALEVFERAAHDLAAMHGARVVKLIGDEAMIAGPDPAEVCRVATELVATVQDEPSLPPARGAVSAGPVTARDGDYFGSVVNVAARAAKAARPGSVVATGDVVSVLNGGEWKVTGLSPVTLRGFDGPVALAEIADRRLGRPCTE